MNRTELDAAMEPLRTMLAADGYALVVSSGGDDDTIVLDVSVTADACEECLSPADVIAAVARSCIPQDSPLARDRIDVHLPPGRRNV
jgi:hypothetical protein